MEDSGIDSEGKLSASFEDITKTIANGNKTMAKEEPADYYDVIFRKAGSNTPTTDSRYNTSTECGPEKKTFRRNQPNTCRILQRKLELKVERAKRNHAQFNKQSQAANLIPINRLSIPENLEKPLVDYNSDNSDEPIEVSFFASKLKEPKSSRRHHELSDTFSIQEMTTESDRESDDDVDTQNLELPPPLSKRNFLDRFMSCFNCKSLRL